MSKGKLSAIHSQDPLNSGRKQQLPIEYELEANRVADDLRKKLSNDTNQPKIYIIGREGQNLRARGIHYSHGAFLVVYPGGEIEVCHLVLDQRGKSRVAVNTLEEFFKDTLYSFDYAIWELPELLQTQLYNLLETKLHILYHGNYNAISAPYQTEDQNCNAWLIEMAKAAEKQELLEHQDIKSRRAAVHTQLKTENYQPDHVPLRLLEQAILPMVAPRIKTNNHQWAETLSGKFRFHSVQSVAKHVALNEKPVIEYLNHPCLAETLHSPPSGCLTCLTSWMCIGSKTEERTPLLN